MIIVVEGHDVEVDDSFAKLSSAEQEKTVNEIYKQSSSFN